MASHKKPDIATVYKLFELENGELYSLIIPTSNALYRHYSIQEWNDFSYAPSLAFDSAAHAESWARQLHRGAVLGTGSIPETTVLWECLATGVEKVAALPHYLATDKDMTSFWSPLGSKPSFLAPAPSGTVACRRLKPIKPHNGSSQ